MSRHRRPPRRAPWIAGGAAVLVLGGAGTWLLLESNGHTPDSAATAPERVPIKSEAIGNTRATDPHLSALDTVGDIQTDRDPDIPLPQAGALHGPPHGGRLAYRSSPAADAHVPSNQTSAVGNATPSDQTFAAGNAAA